MPIPLAATYIQWSITSAAHYNRIYINVDLLLILLMDGLHSLDWWLEWGGGVLVSSCSGPRVSAQSPDAARLPRHQHSSTIAGHNQQIKYHLAGRDHYRYDG